MKSIKYSLLGLLLGAAALTGCQDSYDAPELTVPQATMQPNITLAEFKEFMQSSMTDEGANSLMVPKNENGEDIIIHGRVISCDASGNIYQSLAIQDETAALNLSIREGNMWTEYRVGQEVVINATGLYMGSYNGLYQLGWMDLYNGEPSITFMSWRMFQDHSQLNGMPASIKYVRPNLGLTGEWPKDSYYCLVFNSVKEINDLSPASLSTPTQIGGLYVMSQLVEIQNVSFEDGGVETFAPYQESVNRYIVDAGGNRLIVRTSGYSNFYSEKLPAGTGTVRGILSCYGSDWQLLLRDLDDVIFEDMPGATMETALTVPEATSQENSGRTLWTKGYIVGSVKGGVTTVTSNDDIIFGPDAELNTTLVIAEKPDVTDWAQCMIVELKANSSIREYANLRDHPEVYGQLLYVEGALNEFMGLSGITDTDTNFEVEGVELGGNDGMGTQSSPYTVDYVLKHADERADVWVEGYIVGFVSGSDFQTGAHFANYTDGMDYNGANVIISTSKDGANALNSIPVSCDRSKVGLKNNPGNYGKKIKFYGNVGPYMNVFGMPATTSFVIE